MKRLLDANELLRPELGLLDDNEEIEDEEDDHSTHCTRPSADSFLLKPMSRGPKRSHTVSDSDCE